MATAYCLACFWESRGCAIVDVSGVQLQVTHTVLETRVVVSTFLPAGHEAQVRSAGGCNDCCCKQCQQHSCQHFGQPCELGLIHADCSHEIRALPSWVCRLLADQTHPWRLLLLALARL